MGLDIPTSPIRPEKQLKYIVLGAIESSCQIFIMGGYYFIITLVRFPEFCSLNLKMLT